MTTNLTTELASEIENLQPGMAAPEPGPTVGAKVSMDGMPAAIHNMTSAGYMYVWNNYNYERSVINRNQRTLKLREVFPVGHVKAGFLAFTVIEPAIKPWRGILKCPLHMDQPERAAYDIEGYPTCGKSNIPNVWEARLHMERKHNRTWKAIDATKERLEREEDRALSRQTLIALGGGSQATAPVPEDTVTAPLVEPVEPQTMLNNNHVVQIKQRKNGRWHGKCSCGKATWSHDEQKARTKIYEHLI